MNFDLKSIIGILIGLLGFFSNIYFHFKEKEEEEEREKEK